MRVAINAQLLPDQGVGGAQTALIGLVRALGQLDDGPEEYTIIGPWQHPDWLAPYLGPNQHIVAGPQPSQRFNRVPRALHPVAQAARQAIMNLLGSEITHRPYAVPVSNGFYESLHCDVIHFPFQEFVITSVPAVFNPYDLQHLHFPQFFAPGEIARRETLYPAGCRIARRVAVASAWSKNDIAARYGIPPQKIQVIPLAPPTTAYTAPTGELIRAVRERYRLPESFMLYPAMTWPHKNHLRLLEAVALLRDRDNVRIHLICVGEQHQPHSATIQDRLETLRLADQVQFLGFVPSDHLLALYHAAQFVIIPSLFEGAGLPLLEAWQAEVPAACSAVTSLAEEAADAALLFDPTSVDAIAGAIRQFTSDETLRADYRRRGVQRLKAFSWERTARAYRAVYRQLVGIPLDEAEQSLLAANWMETA